MMDKYYKNLSSFLINTYNISEDDGELYEYAAKVLFQGVISIITTILIGTFLGMLKECLIFVLTFFVLRKFTGGLHVKKFVFCFIGSILLILVDLFAIKYLEKVCLEVPFLCILLVSIIVICILSPIANICKPISKKERFIYKCISINFSLILLLLIMFFMETESLFSYSCGMALNSVSFLIFIAFVKEKINLANLDIPQVVLIFLKKQINKH